MGAAFKISNAARSEAESVEAELLLIFMSALNFLSPDGPSLVSEDVLYSAYITLTVRTISFPQGGRVRSCTAHCIAKQESTKYTRMGSDHFTCSVTNHLTAEVEQFITWTRQWTVYFSKWSS